jgi:hypothetical protein
VAPSGLMTRKVRPWRCIGCHIIVVLVKVSVALPRPVDDRAMPVALMTMKYTDWFHLAKKELYCKK